MRKIYLIIIGIILSFIFLEIALQVTSIIFFKATTYINYKKLKNKVKDNNEITILCVGESTTYEQWPVQLEDFLKNNSKKKFNIISSALPSIDIEHLIQRTFEMVSIHNPDIVISMMGVNNATFKKNKQIYKKHSLKILELLYLIKKHISSKVYADYNINDDKYWLQLVDKYKNNNDTPIEFLSALNKQPNNFYAFVELVYLYHERHDKENVKKYLDMYLKLYPNIIDTKIFVTAISNYQHKYPNNTYDEFNKILIHLLQNKKTCENQFNEILKNSLNYREIEIEELIYIYNLLVNNKIDAYIVWSIYRYLKENNIDVNYPNYNISFMEQPNFNTEEIIECYIELAEFLQKRNITYICMGYPKTSIDIFKNMFYNTNLQNNIIFVSNEQNFYNCLKNNSEDSIFADKFAGNFGHCTYLGNTLIAQNVGKTILDLICND